MPVPNRIHTISIEHNSDGIEITIDRVTPDGMKFKEIYHPRYDTHFLFRTKMTEAVHRGYIEFLGLSAHDNFMEVFFRSTI